MSNLDEGVCISCQGSGEVPTLANPNGWVDSDGGFKTCPVCSGSGYFYPDISDAIRAKRISYSTFLRKRLEQLMKGRTQ